jgi:hypothetical protein
MQNPGIPARWGFRNAALHGLVEITHADPQQFAATTAGFAGYHGAAGAKVDGYCPALNVAPGITGYQVQALAQRSILPTAPTGPFPGR